MLTHEALAPSDRFRPVSAPAVSVIIVAWNNREHLDECLKSIGEAAAQVPLEICVVDNASSDGSAAWLAQAWPQVKCVPSSVNLGFAKACNRALRETTGAPYILFLNPDTRLLPGTLSRLTAYLGAHPKAGAVSGALIDSKGRFQEGQGHRLPGVWTAFNQYLFLNRAFSDRLFPGIYWARRPAGETTVEWISGAFLLVRRQALLGGIFFDEDYFLYGEDWESSLQLRRRGWTLAFLGDASAVHHVKASTRKSPAAVFAMQVNGPLQFLKRHHSPATCLILRALMATGFLLRSALYGALYLLRRRPADRRKGAESLRHLRTVVL